VFTRKSSTTDKYQHKVYNIIYILKWNVIISHFAIIDQDLPDCTIYWQVRRNSDSKHTLLSQLGWGWLRDNMISLVDKYITLNKNL